jgi:hypothetical protein
MVQTQLDQQRARTKLRSSTIANRRNVIRFSEGLVATEITVPPLEPKSRRIIVC